MSYEISLTKLLENRDARLHGRLTDIRAKAGPLLSYTQGKFPHYTPHDFSHSAAVEENLNWLIPDKVKQGMDTFELFFLIVAAWLHDWGMVGETAEDAADVRNMHHVRTERNFDELHDTLHLSEHEARIIGRICKGHRKVDLNAADYDDVVLGQNARIRCRFLAALLRVADECDITHNRTPEVVYYSVHPADDAEAEFKKHLSITGVGQLDETHKIHISAIARDPKGARTLRDVARKIQSELDGVKAILAQSGVPVDLVELRLETRGFIDKPIAFEVDRARIVQLLIGDHLYANQDVAIRELVQNAMDACRLRQALEPQAPCKIHLSKTAGNALVVEDNGLGMDYVDARQFLSTVGSSFRNSESFMKRFEGTGYSPIAQYGIGILSCFLICDRMTVETRKEGQEPCKFTVESVDQEWRYEKGSLPAPGTRITLDLNAYGRSIDLRESLERYMLCPDVPIEYGDGNAAVQFPADWSGECVVDRFVRNCDKDQAGPFRELVRVTSPQYDLILGTYNGPWSNLALFNHGIYVGSFFVSCLSHPYCACVNMRADLVDLQISREDVKENARWRAFIVTLFDAALRALGERFGPERRTDFVSSLYRMLDGRDRADCESESAVFVAWPFLESFLHIAPFAVLKDGATTWGTLSDCLASDDVPLYNCCSSSLDDEIALASGLSRGRCLLINPYLFPCIGNDKDAVRSVRLLPFLMARRGKQCREVDLRDLLLQSCSPSDAERPGLLPKNVRLAAFPKGVRPLVVVSADPVVEAEHCGMGASYWGNILLWKRLLQRATATSYLDSIEDHYDDRFRALKLVREPVVLLDQSDPFVRSLVEAYERKGLDTRTSRNAVRYMRYLSYLPLVVGNLASCVVFLEAIDQLEADLSSDLKLKRPRPVFARMKPSSNLFLQYFRRFGLKYTRKNQ